MEGSWMEERKNGRVGAPNLPRLHPSSLFFPSSPTTLTINSTLIQDSKARVDG